VFNIIVFTAIVSYYAAIIPQVAQALISIFLFDRHASQRFSITGKID